AGTERFLPGARVTFSPIGQAARPGRLRPGAVFAMSDSKGDYAIMVPRAQFEDGAVAVRATHPRFPLVAAYQASALPGLEQNFLLTLFKRVSKWDIIFALSGEAGPNAPPDVFTSHDPFLPSPGTPTSLRVLATDDASVPTIEVSVQAVQSLVPGVEVNPANVSLTLTSTEQVGTLGKRDIYSVLCTNAARVVLGIQATDGTGTNTTVQYAIRFGGVDPVAENPFAASDTNDTVGPLILSSTPR